MRNRNQTISPNYIDNVVGGQVRLLSLSGSVFDGRYVLLSASSIQDVVGGLRLVNGSNPTLALSSTLGQEYYLQTVGSDGSKRFRILNRVTDQEVAFSSSSGINRVGINVSTPQALLHVVNSVTGTDLAIFRDGFNFADLTIRAPFSGKLQLRSGGGDSLWFTANVSSSAHIAIATDGRIGFHQEPDNLKTLIQITGSGHSHFMIMKGAGFNVGIGQNLVGGSATMELTTNDLNGDQATRLMMRGNTNEADVEILKGNSGSTNVVYALFDAATSGLAIGPGYSAAVPPLSGVAIEGGIRTGTGQVKTEPQYCSVTTLTNTNASSVEFNPFDDSSYSSYIENTNWEYNVPSSGIRYDPSLGRFIAFYPGTYKIEVTLFMNCSSTTDTSDLRIYKNGVLVYDVNTLIHTSVSPAERTLTVHLDLVEDDYIEVRIEDLGASTVTGVAGCTFNMYKVADGPTKAYSSVTLLTDSSAIATEYNPFDDGSHASYVENTNWKYNVNSNGVTYSATTGRFTVKKAGIYKLTATIFATVSTTQTIILTFKKNGTIIYTVTPIINSAVDPAERTCSILVAAVADDFFEFTVDSSSTATVISERGTTFNVSRIAMPDPDASLSVQLMTSTPFSASSFNPFLAANHPSFVEGTNWDTLSPYKDMIFHSASGQFTPHFDGAYEVQVCVSLSGNTSQLLDSFILRKNSTTIWLGDAFINSSVDPAERTISGLFYFNSGDLIDVLVDSLTTNTVSVREGTTISFRRL